jgi:hypothetical protein
MFTRQPHPPMSKRVDVAVRGICREFTPPTNRRYEDQTHKLKVISLLLVSEGQSYFKRISTEVVFQSDVLISSHIQAADTAIYLLSVFRK